MSNCFFLNADSVGCSPYVFPARIDLTDNTGEINCIPVFVNSSLSASSITWYKSSEMTGENLTLVDSTRVNFQNSSGVMNAFIVFRMASEEDGAYYFPVTAAIGIDRINEIQPILVTCKFMIYYVYIVINSLYICMCIYELINLLSKAWFAIYCSYLKTRSINILICGYFLYNLMDLFL